MLFVCLIGVVGAVNAGDNEAVVGFVYPCKPAPAPVKIDGKLDAEEWSSAIEVSGFTFSGKGLLANEQMVMRLLYDQKNLYLGVKCSESSMKTLVTEANVHDGPVWNDDSIEFFLDPRHDHEHYHQFAVNTIGTLYEAVGFDWMWNCQWEAAAQRGESAWFVEAAVPFAAFDMSGPSVGQIMGFNLNRERMASGSRELYNWADVQGNFHKPGLFGHLLYVGKDWNADEGSVAAIARQTGAPEARIYMPDGYWEVKENAQPKRFTYSGLIQIQQGTVTGLVNELRKTYTERPEMALKAQFQKLDDRYEEIRSIASTAKSITPEECAAANSFLNNLESSVKDIYWRVKVKLLLETF